MIGLFQMVLLRVTLAGIASVAALRIAGDGALRESVKLGTGLLLLLALLQPLAQLRLPSWGEKQGTESVPAEEIEAQNMQTAMSAVGASIAGSLEKRALEEGIDCSIVVTMGVDEDGLLQISNVTVYYRQQDAGRLEELRALLTAECGITEDRQELIQR